MTIRTVGPASAFPNITAAMLAANAGDIVQIESGYGQESATVTHNGMTVTGLASSTGIVLQLGTGIATFTAGGTAPFTILDAPDGNGIVGNAGDNLITVSNGVDAVDGGAGIDRLIVDYRQATAAVTGNSTSNFTEAGGLRSVTITAGTIEHFTVLTGAGADTITTGAGDDIIDVGGGANTVTAGNGRNSVTGGSGADTVTTGDGDDIISVGDGSNTVQGGQGFNIITGGSGADNLTALDGGNVIDGGDGTNTLTSGAGDDIILSGYGSATISAGAGRDVITVKAGMVSVEAGAGDDRLIVDYSALATAVSGGVTGGGLGGGYTGYASDGGVATVVFVGTENLTVSLGSGNDTFAAGDGIDVLAGNGGDDVLNGAGGNDQLSGGVGSDQLFGGGGRDTLDGGAGDDAIQGGAGNDLMVGGTGNDGYVVDDLGDVIVEQTGEGVDTAFVNVDGWINLSGVEIARLSGAAVLLYGSHGDEDLVANQLQASTVDAMGGNDVVWGSAFNDVLNGNLGDDIIRGQGGMDQMFGGAGNDQFVVFDAGSFVHENAGEGYDVVYFVGSGTFDIGANVEEARLAVSGTGLLGNAGDNLLVGNNSGLASRLVGGGGQDTLWGTAAADTLVGGAGNDTFYSQGGADIFLYDAPGWGIDQIAGFSPGARLQFSAASGVTQFNQLNLNIANGNTQVNYGAEVILVFGAALSATDFIFG